MADTFNLSDVMISYSRRDKPFVQRLESALRAAGREVWVDWEDIPTGVDFMQEIFAGIEAANTFIFIISPDSVGSHVCLEEVRHAVQHHKRFVPILYRSITDDAKEQFHPALSAHNWFYFHEEDRFDEVFGRLLKALDTDVEHVRYHTRLLVRARDWESKGRSNSLLLRGDDLHDAETWLMRNATKEPQPTELHRQLILASRRAAQVRNRVTAGVAVAVLIIAALALVALNQSVVAQREADNAATLAVAAVFARDTSDANAIVAQNNAATATIAQGEALVQANNAAEQATLAFYARATSDFNAEVALNNAATATIAQGEAVVQARTADAAAIAARNAQLTSDANAVIAFNSAATATIAQGNAMMQANNAAEQATLAFYARATSDVNAENASNNAATATIAQGQALMQARTADAAAAIARNAQAVSDANAKIALNSAATATIAQGQALIEANNAAEQATLASYARATSDVNAEVALNNAATAVAAQQTAVYQANRAAEQEALANENATAAVAAQQTVIAVNVTAAAVAQAERDLQATVAAQEAARSRGLALSDSADQVNELGNPDLALVLALEANQADPTQPESFRALAQMAYSPGTRRVFGYKTVISGPITSLVYSPDGHYLLSASRDGAVSLWQAADGTLVRTFGATGEQHQSPVNAVIFNQDGTLVISGDEDGDLIVWEVATGTALRKFGKSTGFDRVGPIIGLAWRASNPNQLLSTNGGNISIWDIQTGQRPNRTILSAEAQVGANLALSRDGAYVMLGEAGFVESDLSAKRFNFEDGWLVAFGPTADRVLMTPAKEANYFWLRDTMQRTDVRRFDGHAGTITSLAFSPDGRYAVSGGGGGNKPNPDYSIILWDVETATPLRRYYGHTGAVRVLLFSPDGSQIISGADDGQIRVWDTQPQSELARYDIPLPVRAMAYRPDGQMVALAYEDQSIALIDTTTGQEVDRFSSEFNDFTNIIFSADGQMLVTADISGSILIWDVATGGRRGPRLSAGDTPAFIALSPAGNMIYAGTGDGIIRRWNASTGKVEQRFDSRAGVVAAVALSPDGRKLVSAHQNPLGDKLIVWDTATGEESTRLDADKVNRVTFSPDGNSILVNSSNTLQLFDLVSGTDRVFGSGGGAHPTPVRDLMFSPDGSAVLSASLDDVRLWDVASGRMVVIYPRGASALAYSPDGQQFAASFGNPDDLTSTDNTLSLYRVGSRSQFVTWLQANRFVRELSCDERDLYNIPPLCDAAVRALTPTPQPEIGTIQADSAINVRSAPGDNAKQATSVRPGTEVEILKEIPGWVNIRLPNGREGWVKSQFVIRR